MADISHEALDRLAEYWGRAQIMRKLFKDLIDTHGGIKKVLEKGYGIRLEAYLIFWMAALFVTVEGFNKLKFKDARVQRLFKDHVNDLKELRHETYHFTVVRQKGKQSQL